MRAVAKIYTDFHNKFGIPRQSGLVRTFGRIVFEPEFRNPDCVKGLDDFSHIWVIWEFSENKDAKAHLTARPPRLGGNVRKGIFATRSPFRTNSLGLSLLKLEEIQFDSELGPVLIVSGVDMLSGSPIFDIKPYLPYVEAIPDAKGGFTETTKDYHLDVELSESGDFDCSTDELEIIFNLLREDPRPSYQEDPTRIYGFEYKDFEIKFHVADHTATIVNIQKR